MKNAILPTLIIISGTFLLSWHEYSAYQQESERQQISVSLFETENPELKDLDNNHKFLANINNLDKKRVKLLAQKHKTDKSLISDNRFKQLKTDLQLLTRIELLKKLSQTSASASTTLAAALLEEHGQHRGVLFNAALAYRRAGDLQTAQLNYEKLLALYPEHQAGTINLGLLYKKTKQWKKARHTLNRAVTISNGEKKAKSLAALGRVHIHLNEDKKALKAYRKSIQYRPSHSGTWLALAQVMSKLEQPYHQVIMTFERAARLSPSQFKIWETLGLYQLESLEFNAAKESFNKAISLAPFRKTAHRGLAWSLFENQEYQLASEKWMWLEKNEKSKLRRDFAGLMQQHIQTDDHGDKNLQTEINHILKNKTLANEVKNDYEYLLLISRLAASGENAPYDFNSVDSLRNIESQSHRRTLREGKCALDQKNYLIAKKLLAILLNKLSNNAEIHYLLAQTLSKSGDYAGASVAFESAMKLAPNRVDIQIARVNSAILHQRLEVAGEQLSSIINAQPENFPANMLVGELAWIKKDWKKIKAQYGQLAGWKQNESLFLYRLAFAMYQLGEFEKSKDKLNSLMEVYAEHIAGRELLAQIYCRQGQKQRCREEANRILKLDHSNKIAAQLIR